MKDVEWYDPRLDTWTSLPNMLEPRGGVSAVVKNGYLYALGGNDGNDRLRSVEKLNLSNRRRWIREKDEMNTSRCRISLKSLRNFPVKRI